MAIYISVIIPAFNAATTIAQTMDSLLAQTVPYWEAVVINDGSVDETVNVMNGYAEKDTRIRIHSQSNQGLSAARNTGIDQANWEWLLFLDADDWISPNYIERTTCLIADDSNLDAVHCGWVRVTPDGTHLMERYAPSSADLFPTLAKMCPFAVHSCLVRKTIAIKAGSFDPLVKNCQDWDFWQRVARTGAKFGGVKEILAFYRMQPNSLSSDEDQFYTNAMKMLIQGHSYDPRVLQPHPNYKNGQSVEELPGLKLYLTSWFAGLFLGKEKDAVHLLQSCIGDHEQNLDPRIIGENIFETVLISNNQSQKAWVSLWPKIEKYLNDFLVALEVQSTSDGLARSTQIILQGMILEHTPLDRSINIGTTQGIQLEITEPVPDIFLAENSERLLCMLKMEGNILGKIELPVFNKMMPAWLLNDAIAANFSWQILRRFFEHTVYKNETIKSEFGTCDPLDSNPENIHNKIGWKIFLQQLWNPEKDERDNLIKKGSKNKRLIRLLWKSEEAFIEVSKDIPKITLAIKKNPVVLKVGGIAAGVINLPDNKFILTEKALKNKINKSGTYELCRICVRETLIGKPLNDPTPIRERLKMKLAVDNTPVRSAEVNKFNKSSRWNFLTPQAMILANRNDIMGTSSSRCAILPVNLADELKAMAASCEELVDSAYDQAYKPDNVFYMPELINQHLINLLKFKNNGKTEKTETNFSVKCQSIKSSEKSMLTSGHTRELPILRYNRISKDDSIYNYRHNVTPELFEKHLQYLHQNNYYSVEWNDWITSMFTKTPLPGNAIAITFDQGSFDIYRNAWPLLRQYGFTATVLLTTGFIGKKYTWNKFSTEDVELMGWKEIKELQNQGIQFGSHSATHKNLTSLSPVNIVNEAVQSRTIIQEELGNPIKIFAYPYGHTDSVVSHLVGACGYIVGLTSKPGLCTFKDDPMALPRVPVNGSYTIENFASSLKL